MEKKEMTVDTNGGTAIDSDDNNSVPTMSDESIPENPNATTFRSNLTEGFKYLRQRRDTKEEQITEPPSVLPSFLSRVTVNFIDPTSSSIAASTSSSNARDNNNTANNNKKQPVVQLYEKFVTVFERDFSCTLSYVPFERFRNNSTGVIDTLPVQTVVARSHGGGLVLPDADHNSSVVLQDYAWERPYCHVYLAACESLEHYRTKVKPSIQAFVSQLEAAVKPTSRTYRRQASNSMGSHSDNNNNSGSTNNGSTTPTGTAITVTKKAKHLPKPRYVIIFVPTGRDKGDDGFKRAGGGGTVGLAGRFAAARQRMTGVSRDGASAATTTTSSNSTTATDASDDTPAATSGYSDDASVTTDSTIPNMHKLTKVDREIARRFTLDFPSGNVCTLSTLIDIEEDYKDKDEMTQKLEWNSVLKAMGVAIAGGFMDRCQRFDDELRKLDLQRRGESGAKADIGDEARSHGFHLCNFFLVKESLAFTYEQMRIPGEALLQYEELRAFLPETDPTSGTGTMETNDKNLLQMALTGDSLEFRRLLRSYGEFDPVVNIANEYVFAREVALLFQTHKSVRVAHRCLAYVERKFRDAMACIEETSSNDDDTLEKAVALNKWAFRFCWDVKNASDWYCGDGSTKTSTDVMFARVRCTLLEFVQLRLLKLGDLKVPGNTIQNTRRGLIDAINSPWSDWTEPPSAKESNSSEKDIGSVDLASEAFLDDALSSPHTFSQRYLELTKVITASNEFCGRRRYAARLRLERMEIYAGLGENKSAASEISAIAGLYRHELWHACDFALLFRLATLQRQSASANQYLSTLVNCFSEDICRSAPTKALAALYSDLNMVVKHPSTNSSKLKQPSLFSPAFGLERVIAPRSVGTDRKLLKRLYTVGDKIVVTLNLDSYLPEPINMDTIQINLVPFQSYVAAMEDSVPIDDSAICRVLTLQKPDALNPGNNEYCFDWHPKRTGQYIVSSVNFFWDGVEFTYTAKTLKRPTIRVDVVPCAATQTLKIKPEYLVPGHDQPLSFEFSSGTDVIEKGVLQVVGSPGLLFIPPGSNESANDSWVPTFEIPLPDCSSAGTASMLSKVRVVDVADSTTSVQPAQVKVTTSYQYGNQDSDDSPAETMESALEVKIPTLGQPVLSVLDTEHLPYAAEKAMVHAILRCHTPTPFTIKAWSIDLPQNMRLSNDIDLNDSLVDVRIVNGDRVSMSFDCTYENDTKVESKDEPVLHIDVENDLNTVFQLRLNLKIERPLIPKATDIKTKASASTVVLSVSENEGLVGVPIELEYKVDSCILQTLDGKIVYSVQSNDPEWIVSGKVRGDLSTKEGSCLVKVVAIPVRSGPVQTYPAMALALKKESGVALLPVDLKMPPLFTAVAPPHHMAIAYPAGSAVKRSAATRSSF